MSADLKIHHEAKAKMKNKRQNTLGTSSLQAHVLESADVSYRKANESIPHILNKTVAQNTEPCDDHMDSNDTIGSNSE